MTHSHIVALLAFLSIFGSCRKTESTHVRLSRQISDPYISEMSKQYCFKYFGGGGAFLNTVNEISIIFVSPYVISLDECRLQYVRMIETLLKKYNSNEEIRPYLGNYPFEPKNLEILIVYNLDPNLSIPNRVYSVTMINGVIFFEIKDTDSVAPENYIKEPFEEAYFKVYGKEWTP
ncbi:MAG: hypothetical protein KDK62_04530 [Chlamydiia bacterium]|nr:hypothetical protein [Chlamydiia bacterium]